MGMEVNNSRLSGMDQGSHAAQHAQKADQTHHADKSKAEQRGHGAKPEANDVEAFERNMRGPAETELEVKLPSAENLFAGMFGAQQQGAGQAAQVGQAAPVGAPDAMDAVVDKMVDRILVSEPGKGQQEVRLSFNDSALKGTEVTLFRSLDGQLNVKLNTTDAASYQTLVGAQDSLRTALERSGQNVRVEANLSSNQQDNNPNQRSSTYAEYRNNDD